MKTIIPDYKIRSIINTACAIHARHATLKRSNLQLVVLIATVKNAVVLLQCYMSLSPPHS